MNFATFLARRERKNHDFQRGNDCYGRKGKFLFFKTTKNIN